MHKLIKVDKNGKKTIITVPDWADFEVADGMFGPGTGSLEIIRPFIINNPQSITTNTGSTVQFTANAAPAGPFDNMIYQWESGSNKILVDNARYTGSTTLILTITNVVAGNAGTYFLKATTPYGSVTSSAATLTVV